MSLARAIETDRRDAPRAPEDWVKLYSGPRPGTRDECVVRENRTGKHYIGRLISYSDDPFVEVELLGATERTVWFERGEATVSSLPPHQWRERQLVAERQRRGEPAATRSAAADALAEKNAESARRGWAARKERLAQMAAEPLPRGLIHRLAAELGIKASFVASAYRRFVVEHEAEPTNDQLLDACAALELEEKGK